MKIYTEINYKWLDGGLVETDSKSFEYEGYLTLCGPGGGGGGDPISKAVTKVAEVTTAAVTDPVGSVKAGLDTAVTTTGESLKVGADLVGDNLQTLVENNPIGTEGLGMNEGVATTLADVGSKIDEGVTSFGDKLIDDDLEDWVNEGVDKIHDFGKDLNDIVSDELTRWSDFAMEKNKEISDAMGITGDDPAVVTIDPDKFAVDSSKKKKNKSDLAVNKAKKRSRKSLRIG